MQRGGHQAAQAGCGGARRSEPEVQERAHHALPRAPQAVGIAAARGREAQAEVAGQGVELVRHGHGREHAARGIGGERLRGRGIFFDRDRPVVPAHGIRHHRGGALPLEVERAHDALQLGELAHHQRGQVGLGQARRRRRRAALALVAERGRERILDQRDHAVGLLAVAAQLAMEGDAGEVLQAVHQRPLEVLGQEERGVAQPRHHHALHAAHDLARGVVVRVRERAHQRDVLLVMDEHDLEDLGGQRAELLRDAPEHDGRVLDQVLPLREQAEVVDLAPILPRELGRDALRARLGSEDHEVLLQALAKLVIEAHLHRPARPAAGQEAMSARGVAGLDDRASPRAGLGGVDRERHDLPVEQGHHPADRPPEGELALAVVEPRVPAHALGEGEAAQQHRDDAGQHVARVAAWYAFDMEGVLFRRFGGCSRRHFAHDRSRTLDGELELIDRYSEFSREAFRRLCPVSGGILGDPCRWTPDWIFHIGLAGRHVAGHGQPPRRGRGLDDLGHEVLAARQLDEPVAHLLGEAGEPARGHLLDADLEQELSHDRPRPFPRHPRIAPRSRRPACGWTGSCPRAGSRRSRRARRAR